ncbi:MAG: OprO/OprP family phosphate-selective porin [Alistipes sp.]|jgi:hypothetical protein|nr:OprO/OprP family phosphate-selective porin [Alistipes sp.]
MKRSFLSTVFALLWAVTGATAQSGSDDGPSPGGGPDVTVVPTGTVRAKFEYQPSEGNARFDVRTARFGVGGTVYQKLDYKMEIDLSDEGRIRMVDAWVGAKIHRGLSFNMGYMRVPFTIDAHRSPHLQHFANRSFIAKQVGGTRDVGAVLGWRFGRGVPFNVQLGVFNGSGLAEDLQRFWTRSFDWSAKVQAGVLPGIDLVASYHTAMPGEVRTHLYDAGVTCTSGRWLVEGEFLRKEYAEGAFAAVNSVDVFALYGLPLERGPFERISFLGRWDYLDDHSNGVAGADGALTVNDPARHRATAGVTLSLGLPFTADIRVNYEKYLYRAGAATLPGPSDHDKIVIELMAHF